MTKEENPLYFMENNWPEKFDFIIANPPFNKSLHLKFLEKSLNLYKEGIVFVQPASFLVEIKGAHKIFSSTRELIKEVVNDITIFNGNGVFGIQLFVPCSIITIDKKTPTDKINVSNLIYNNIKKIDRHEIHGISLFGYREEINSISKKVLSKNYKNLLSAATVRKDEILPSPDMFTVGFSRIMGHSYNGGGIKDKLHKESFFTFIPKSKFDSCIRDSNKEFSKKGYEIWFEFKTLKEATNFRNFLTTYFARACLATIKFAQSLCSGELKGIPYLDFTQEWTDEKLYKEFNITEEEQAFIKEIIPPYYD